ncbi:30S ribosomal protein S13 [Candidatus Mycoplasma haematohominis]|uniref:Small ribosomal subunit protein uS13 n=1 Tax=Candidatus Mycoplasma haematohominis TaxID=1494318 RepID=A0A478FSA2_9MOLU|nr:30S ribosomal protein S13 [Candidatus Mycoplasma haemohominis]GCE63954.1 30S ribosomal protein S13 [Candidatus Mycoplasma haemohominis]
MPRLLGVDIPANKSIYVALTHIYGIGFSLSKKIIQKSFLNAIKPENKMDLEEKKKLEGFLRIRVKDLTKDQLSAISQTILQLQKNEEKYVYYEFLFEGDLRKKVMDNIKNQIEINSYVGIRHKRGLPVHGQRTRTNARTRKGPRKTVANKKIESK